MPPLVLSSLDIRNLRTIDRAIQAGRSEARGRAARTLGSMILARVVRQGMARAADTHRYIAAYARAHNDIAEQPMAIPAITQSRMVPIARAVLEKRIAFYDRVARDIGGWIAEQRRRYGARADGWPSVQRSQKRLNKVVRNLAFAREQLAVAGTPDGAYAAVVFGRKTGADTAHLKSGVTRVLTAIYGGTAEAIDTGEQTLIKMTNFEPHAAIVEKRVGLMRETLGLAGRLGVRRVARAHLQGIEKQILVANLPGATRVMLPPPEGGL